MPPRSVQERQPRHREGVEADLERRDEAGQASQDRIIIVIMISVIIMMIIIIIIISSSSGGSIPGCWLSRTEMA